MLSMRHTGGQISGAREYWRTHSWKVPSAMNGCDNLGLRTSTAIVDQCNRVCVQRVQSIQPGILRSTRSVRRRSAVDTAHY